MQASYSPVLTTFSFIIFILSIYTTLLIVERIFDGVRSHRRIWIITGILVMATGIFSMDFLAMIAHHVAFPMRFNLTLLMVAYCFALITSLTTFLTLFLQLSKAKHLISILFIAAGLLSLNYSAVYATDEPFTIQFTSIYFFLAIMFAMGFAFLTLKISINMKMRKERSLFMVGAYTFLLGIVILLLDYFGMKSINFIPHSHDLNNYNGLDTFTLGIILTINSLLIMISVLVTARLDYHAIQKEKQLVSQLKESDKRYHDLVEHSPEAIVVLDGEKIVFANEVCIKNIRAKDKNELIGRTVMDFIHPDYQEKIKNRFLKLKQGDPLDFSEVKLIALDGSIIDAESTIFSITYDNTPAIQIIVRILTEEKKIKRALVNQQQQFLSLFQYNPNPVFSLDLTGQIRDFNPPVWDLFGYSKEDLVGKYWYEVIDSDFITLMNENYNKVLQGSTQKYDLHVKAKDGRLIACNITNIPIIINSMVEGSFVIVKDMTRENEAISQVKKLAFTDQLTGLPNRRWFYQHLSEVIQKAKKEEQSLALLAIDFDNFKDINDLLGHQTGDIYLQKVSKKLTNTIDGKGKIVRLGGDEFIIVLENITKKETVELAERILRIVNEPIEIAGHEMLVTLSIGISIHRKCTVDVETILKQADLAMYLAKEKGKNNYQFFNETLNEQLERKLQLENALRKAIDHEEFILYYQPQIDMRTDKLAGLEGLLRWNSPYGNVEPSEFIPIAEKTGLIVPIGEWAIREVCRRINFWKHHEKLNVPISVNVSVRQFIDPNFTKRVAQIMDEQKINPAYLMLEITESIMMDFEDTVKITQELKSLGIKIAIDDFGAGYSNLHLMTKLEFDILKIDKSLVDIHNEQKMKILDAIIKSNDAQIVIEGIETKEEYEVLKEYNTIGQGYYFARPMPPEDLLKLGQV